MYKFKTVKNIRHLHTLLNKPCRPRSPTPPMRCRPRPRHLCGAAHATYAVPPTPTPPQQRYPCPRHTCSPQNPIRNKGGPTFVLQHRNGSRFSHLNTSEFTEIHQALKILFFLKSKIVVAIYQCFYFLLFKEVTRATLTLFIAKKSINQ